METDPSNKNILSLEDYRDALWTCQCCTCGFCLFECQAFKLTGLESAGARGRNSIALGILNGELSIDDIPDLFLYVCTTCRYCEQMCSQNLALAVGGERHLKISGATTSEILRSMKVSSGRIPPSVRDALKGLATHGNPYGLSGEIKDYWVKNLGIMPMEAANKDVIFYVGALVPYEDKSRRAAEAILDILLASGLRVAMLGSQELSSGGLTRPMGEEWLCDMFINHCTEKIHETGVKRIVCLSPHDYDAFLHYYKNLNIEVEHYTQTLLRLINEKRIRLSSDCNKKVTYQDPCYLGRRNNVYGAPREVLNSIPGIDIIEMRKIKNEAHCCGGGGVGLWVEFPEARMDLQRAEEAGSTGAEILATACPICLQMLDSAVKAKGYPMEVKDIGTILRDCIKGTKQQ